MQVGLRLALRDTKRLAPGKAEHGFGQSVVVVTKHVAFVDEAAGNWFDAEGADAVEVGLDGTLTLKLVSHEEGGRNGRGVDNGVIEEGPGAAAAVLEDFFDVL